VQDLVKGANIMDKYQVDLIFECTP
jgi:dynein heavy chain